MDITIGKCNNHLGLKVNYTVEIKWSFARYNAKVQNLINNLQQNNVELDDSHCEQDKSSRKPIVTPPLAATDMRDL
jgi:hypothetical protein